MNIRIQKLKKSKNELLNFNKKEGYNCSFPQNTIILARGQYSLQSSLPKQNSPKQSLYMDSSFLTSWFSFSHSSPPPNHPWQHQFPFPTPPHPSLPATCHSLIRPPFGACDHRYQNPQHLNLFEFVTSLSRFPRRTNTTLHFWTLKIEIAEEEY